MTDTITRARELANKLDAQVEIGGGDLEEISQGAAVLRTLCEEVERLTGELQARHQRQHDAEALAGEYLMQHDDARAELERLRAQVASGDELTVAYMAGAHDARRAAPAQQADAELESRTGEPHVNGWPLYSCIPPAQQAEPCKASHVCDCREAGAECQRKAAPSLTVGERARALVEHLWKTDLNGIPFHLVADLKAALDAQPAAQAEPVTAESLPHPGSLQASAMIDSVLNERQWPTNPKNAARAGYVAAMRLLGVASDGAAQAGPVAQMRSHPVRFAVRDGGRWIDDDDFTFDAMLKIDGDFGSDEARAQYAAMLCERLNAGESNPPAQGVGDLPDAMSYAAARNWAVTKEWARGFNDARAALAQAPAADLAAAREDAERLDYLEHEANELRTVATAEDDFDWVVISSHMDAPQEREVGRGKGARAAIDAARKAASKHGKG